MIWDEFLAKRTKKSPKAHTKTDTSSQEKLFGEIQNSFLFFLLLVIFSTSAFAQKVEHGVLVGGGIGFPMQDSKQLIPPTNELRYDHNLKGNGMIGYRLRFLPQRKHFFDLDLTIGFQSMSTQKYVPFLSKQDGTYTGNEGDEFSEFVMPVSIAASWNYRITGKFFFGLGMAPTLYVRPQAVFDLPFLAKVGYRVGKHCELALSYQYGCLDVLKHFNKGWKNMKKNEKFRWKVLQIQKIVIPLQRI